MRRADRLFRLVEILRSKRLATGSWLAEQLGVSLRTLYRDIADLSLSGVPIEGEAGVGYRLRYRLDVPPLLFDPAELEALLVGSRMVQAWARSASPRRRRRPWPKSTTSCPNSCAAKPSKRNSSSPRCRMIVRITSPNCAVPCANGESFAWPTRGKTVRRRNARSGRSVCSSGAGTGRSSAGACYAMASAISV